MLFLLLLVIVIEIVIIAPEVLDTKEPQESSAAFDFQDQSHVEQKLTGLHLIESRQEEKEWELWSDEAKTYKNKNLWDLEKVKVRFFGKEGVIFDVTGVRGQVEVHTKNIEIMGQVVTRSSNGYTFRTERVKYNSIERTLFGSEDIEMVGPADANKQHMILKGKDLVANLDSALMEIKSEVSAKRPVKDNKKLHIKSQRAQFSGRSRYARFLDNVVIDYDTMRVTGPDATFNYDSNNDTISSILVQGGVKVSDLDKWATSQSVNVEFDKDQYVFRGNPRVVQNNDELKGEEIIFYNGGKRVKVLKARANLEDGNSRVMQ